MTSVLIVEDDKTQRKILDRMLSDQGYQVQLASSGSEALALFNTPTNDNEFDIVLLDLVMPTVSGIEVLNKLQEIRPTLPVIILTSHSDVDRVVEVMRAGAADFIAKPPLAEKLQSAIQMALARQSSKGDERRDLTSKKIGFEDIVGESAALQKAVAMARKGAASGVPILIEGESGVGKEMFARAIQSASNRADKPFVAVNCGAIPANLVESILFGHEKGAFTGAVEKHDGKFQEASGGTLFLDEIGELPLETQVKLLRAIQEGMVDPVGGSTPVKVDVRLISATNKTLIEQVGRGEFREDLMYRLNVFPVVIPPLRRRREDIGLLVDHFIKTISASQKRSPMAVSKQARALLTTYDWPGNVRQLENAVFRALILADGEILDVEDFPLIENTAKTSAAERPAEGSKPVLAHSNEVKARAPGDVEETIKVFDALGELRPLGELEAEVIEKALAHYNGHMSEIARRLGIGRSTLYRKISELGLDADQYAAQNSRS